MEDNDDRYAQIVNVVVLDDPPTEIMLDDNGTIHEIPLQDDAHCLIVTKQPMSAGAYRSINI
jgi:hypothetical protein